MNQVKCNTVFNVKEFTSGYGAIYTKDGEKLKNEIYKFIKDCDCDFTIEISFEGVDSVLTTFLNPVFGDLIMDHGSAILKHILISNYNIIIKKQIISTINAYVQKNSFFSNPDNHNIKIKRI